MRRLPLLMAALLVPATSAFAAPVLAPLAPCYRSVPAGDGRFETEPVLVNGTGFTPGARVEVTVDGGDAELAVADATGAIEGSVAAPGIARGERAFTVTATEPADPAQSVSLGARVVNLTAKLTPRRASPRRTVVFTGAGFTDAAPVYAHYLRRGRTRRTVRLAPAPTGACGHFSVRRAQFPFHPKAGRWQILIHQAPTAGAEIPSVRIDVRVRPTRT